MRVGTELFALRGFDGVSVDDIARRARVNKALVSYHFHGKRGLYRALLRSTLAAAIQRMGAFRDSPRPAAELLAAFIAEFHRMATVERPHFPALLLREVLSDGRTFHEDVAPEIIRLFEIVRGILDRGVREGAFRPVNPFLAHIGIIGTLAFFYATEPTRRRLAKEGRLPIAAPSSEDFVRHTQQMVLRGLAAGAPPSATEARDSGERR
jgi:TetR/AcrR family transcriptional regulator